MDHSETGGSRRIRPLLSVGYFPADDIRTTIEIARELDGGIVDTLWIGDSPLVWRECWTSIALAMAATETLRFGPSVTNPVNRHWTITASIVQTLHEYATGRIRLGIGVGDSSLRRLNQEVASRAELRAAVDGIRSLLAGSPVGDGKVSWDRPSIPVEILLSGSGPKTLELAGAVGDGAIIVPGVVPSAVEQVLKYVATGRQAEGRSGRPHSVLWVACAIGEEEQAWADVRPWVSSVLRHPLVFTTSPEVDAARERIRAGYDFAHHMSHESRHGDMLPVEVLRDFAVAGNPDEVGASLSALADLPIDEIALVLMGRHPREQAKRLNRLLAESWLQSRPVG